MKKYLVFILIFSPFFLFASEKENFNLSYELINFSSSTVSQGEVLVIKVEGDLKKITLQSKSLKIKAQNLNFFKLKDKFFAILGISVKNKPGKYELNFYFKNGKVIKKSFEIIEKEFPVTELKVTPALEKKGIVPSTIVKTIFYVNLAIKEVIENGSRNIFFDDKFFYPLEKIEVVGAFGNIRKNNNVGARHLGVDLKADMGTNIYAINNGIVRMVEDLPIYGKTVIIDHGGRIFSFYLHLEEFYVKEGQFIERGKIIGKTGNTGYSLAPHLHFSVNVNGVSVDPLKFIETINKEINF